MNDQQRQITTLIVIDLVFIEFAAVELEQE
jgi:hypothetical protein